MLKLMPSSQLNQQINRKCGEIFCDNFTVFTITCCFCHNKLSAYEDFLRHIQQGHFENNLLENETEITGSDNEFIKVEYLDNTSEEEMEIGKLEESLDVCYDDEGEGNVMVKAEDVGFEEEIINEAAIRNSGSEEDDYEVDRLAENSPNDKTIKDILSKLRRKKPIIPNISCPECEQLFPRLADLDQHVFETHKGFKCSMCNTRFRHRHHLRRHENRHNAVKEVQRIPCPVENCLRSFAGAEYLKYHLQVHTLERTFVCDFDNCGKAFQSKQRLKQHRYTHDAKRMFVCDTCGHKCRAYASLLTHQRVHTGEKPFACKVCEKTFGSKSTLYIHMITHSSKRPYVCQICKTTFAKYCILQRHIYIHSEEKSFKCKLCDKAFKQPHGLDGHMRRLHWEPKVK